MKQKIRLIAPLVTEGLRLDEYVADLSDAQVEVSAVILETGPASVEGSFDEALAVPGVVNRVIEAEQEGCAAAIIDCMSDPGLEAAREVAAMPVFGPAQTSMHVASTIGHRFSMLAVLGRQISLFDGLAAKYGVAGNMASVRSVEIPVLELEKNPGLLCEGLVRQAILAVEEDGADTVILGCTGLAGLAGQVRDGLAAEKVMDVLVVDPIESTVAFAAGILKCGLGHSKRVFSQPRQKRIVGYDVPGRSAE